MANDVSIVVSAELGDTLIKLDLAKHAVNDLGDASVENAAKQDEAAASSAAFGDSLAGLNDALTTSVPLLGGFSVPLAALPVVLFGAEVAVIALADAIGTLIAIVGDLVAPVAVVTGLLGLLGIGFALAAQKALGMHSDGLGQAVSGLKKQFEDLTTTLVGRFMPVFQFLIHNASQALDFLNRIAKLPLNDAFRQLAQQGIPAVEKFLEKVGSMVAKPIRLALKIAFGAGQAGNEASAAVSQLWNQLSNFLFGYSKTHILRINGQAIKLTEHVDGIFQPILDWFNRHDFTKQGEKIGHELLNGLKPFAKPLADFIVRVLEDAVKTAAVADANFIKDHLGFRLWPYVKELAVKAWDYIRAHARQVASDIENWVKTKIGQAWTWVKTQAGNFWDWLRDKAGGIINSIVGWIEGKLSSAWNPVKNAANDFLNILHKIGDFFSQVFTLNINWPSPPSWLTSLGGILGGGGSSSTAGRTGQGGNSPSGNVVMHANFHYHAAGSSNDSASFRRFARDVGREIGRQNHILAGGQ